MSNWTGMEAPVSNDICLAIDDLVEGYAFGALGTDEMLMVAERIADCPEQLQRLNGFEEAIGLMGLAVPPIDPQPQLWARLESSIGQLRTTEPIPLRTTAPRTLSVPRWAASLAAVMVLALLASTIGLAIALQGSDDNDDTFEAMMTEYVTSGGSLMPMNSIAAPEILTWPAKGTLVVAPDMTPMIVVDDCVPDSDEFEYRVWVSIGGERTPMGRLSINEDGRGMMMLEGLGSLDVYDLIGITIRTNDDHRYDVMEVSLEQEN